MSQFTPNQVVIDPPNPPDALGQAAMQSLSRPILGKRPWGVVRSSIFGLLTCGILPLISWPRRFGRYVIAERQQFWSLLEYLRLRGGSDPEAIAALQTGLHTGSPPRGLWIGPVIALATLVPLMNLHWQHPLLWLYTITYSHQTFLRHFYPASWIFNSIQISTAHRAWTLVLMFAYTLHESRVREHNRQVKSLVQRINPLLVAQNLEPVRSPGASSLVVVWFLPAIVGAAVGAWWALFASLAGAMQSQTRWNSTQLRRQLAGRVRQLLLQQNPPVNFSTPYRLRRNCSNRFCGKPVPPQAAFCPNCGTPSSQSSPLAV